MTTRRLMSARELAEVIGLHHSSVRRLAAAGQLPRPMRLSPRTHRWDWAEVEAFLKAKGNDAH